MHEITRIAESVREHCVEAALQAYEEAGISGLCAEGRWELAIQAIRCLDLSDVIGTTAGQKSKPCD